MEEEEEGVTKLGDENTSWREGEDSQVYTHQPIFLARALNR